MIVFYPQFGSFPLIIHTLTSVLFRHLGVCVQQFPLQVSIMLRANRVFYSQLNVHARVVYTRVVHNVAPEPNLAPWQNLFGSFAFYFV